MDVGESIMGKRFVPYGYKFDSKKKRVIDVADIKFEFTFPDDFCVVCATREQDGLFIARPPKGLLLIRDTLKHGDYSIKGFERYISIERKNMEDLWSSVTVNADRFKRELEELANYERKYILVEGLESQFLRPDIAGRQIHPNAVRQALASIEGKLGIPVHSAETRSQAERWMLDMFLKYFSFKRSCTSFEREMSAMINWKIS